MDIVVEQLAFSEIVIIAALLFKSRLWGRSIAVFEPLVLFPDVLSEPCGYIAVRAANIFDAKDVFFIDISERIVPRTGIGHVFIDFCESEREGSPHIEFCHMSPFS